MSDLWSVHGPDGLSRTLDVVASIQFLDQFANERLPEVIQELREQEQKRTAEERVAFGVGYAQALSELRSLMQMMADAPEPETADVA